MHLWMVLRSVFITLAVGACASGPVGPTGPSADGSATTQASGGGEAATSPGLTLTPSFIRPTPLPAPTSLAYAVKTGDTLTSIARAFGTTPRSIAFWSRDAYPSLDPESAGYAPNRLEIGWILRVIPGEVFDEDELPATTPTAAPSASSEPLPGASAGATSS